MNIIDAENLALELMVEHNLLGWSFSWDNARTRSGLTNYTHKRIALSKPVTRHRTEAEVRDTILHEIAHALVGPNQGHNSIWRAKAVEIGCSGNRSSTFAEVENFRATTAKYTAVCEICGAEHHAMRRSKNMNSYICAATSECRLSAKSTNAQTLIWVQNH